MAEALIKYETIDGAQIDDIMHGQPPRPPKGSREDNRRIPPKGPLSDSPSQAGTIRDPVTAH
jgi:cell division protease FtsH